jgi:hypothetical protein
MNHYGTIAGVYHFFWVTSVIVRYAYPPSRGKRFDPDVCCVSQLERPRRTNGRMACLCPLLCPVMLLRRRMQAVS